MSAAKAPVTAQVTEPPLGSVLMLHSDSGTAAQRFYSDGLYRIVGKTGAFTYADLLAMTTRGGAVAPTVPLVVYVPPPDDNED